MNDAMLLRGDKIKDFRKYIAIRAKFAFHQYLLERQYEGALGFDHKERKLVLSIKTTDQELTKKGNQRKDTKSLSGGEKSFSTVAFFLSLWEAIESPIRCLVSLFSFDSVSAMECVI